MKQTIYVRTKRSKCVGELENSQHAFVRECLASTFFHLRGVALVSLGSNSRFGLYLIWLIFATKCALQNNHATSTETIPNDQRPIHDHCRPSKGHTETWREVSKNCHRLWSKVPDLIWLHKLLSLLSLLSLVKVFCFVPFESFRLSLENRPQWEVEGSVPPSEKSKGRVFRCQTTCITNCVLCVICVICVARGTGCTKLKGTPESFALRQVVLNLASLQLKIWPSLTIKECTLGSQNNTSTVWNVLPTNK